MLQQDIKVLPIDKLSNIVGGRYRLVTLVTKRMRAILGGSPILVEIITGERLIETVCREIEAGKIWLETPEAVAVQAPGVGEELSDLLAEE